MADLVLPVPSGMVGCWLAGVPDSITETSGAVSQWNDLSGNGLHFKQSASGSRPTKSTVFDGGAIDFASASFLSLDAAYTGTTGDAYTVAMAFNIPTWVGGYRGISLQNGTSKYVGIFDTTSTRQCQLYAGGSTTTTSNTSMAGRKYLVAAGRAGTGSCVMRVDGSSQIGTDSATGNLEFRTFGRYDGTYGGFGSVAALIVWSRRLDLSEIETVEEFLASIVATGSPPYTNYALSGTVEGDDGAPAARAIRAFREDTGGYVGGVVSDGTTGAYSLLTTYAGEHTLVAYPVTGESLPALVLNGVIPV